jgi:hypothetical protein
MSGCRASCACLRAVQAAHALSAALPASFLVAFAASILLARVRSGAWPAVHTHAPFTSCGPSPSGGIDSLVMPLSALFLLSVPAAMAFPPVSLFALACTLWNGREPRLVLAWACTGALSALGLWVVVAFDPGGFFGALLG